MQKVYVGNFMPHYDYCCSSCQHTEEVFQKITDNPLTTCPACKQATWRRKIGSGAALHFKGSGFYQTDYTTAPKSQEETPPSSPPHKCCPCGKNSSCSHS